MTDINQLWVADLTYLRLAQEFAYLAVVLDAYSRPVIGWALGSSLEFQLTLSALEQAIATRQPSRTWFAIPTRASSTLRKLT